MYICGTSGKAKKRNRGNLYVNNTQEIQHSKKRKKKIAGIKFKKAHDQDTKHTHECIGVFFLYFILFYLKRNVKLFSFSFFFLEVFLS